MQNKAEAQPAWLQLAAGAAAVAKLSLASLPPYMGLHVLPFFSHMPF